MVGRPPGTDAHRLDAHRFEQLVVEAGEEGVDLLDALASLVDHSLMLTEPAGEGPMRYRMLEPVRQYGESLLAAGDRGERVRRRYAQHYLAIAGRCEPFRIRGEPADGGLDDLGFAGEEIDALVGAKIARQLPG